MQDLIPQEVSFYFTIKAKIVHAVTNKIAVAITARVIITWNMSFLPSNQIETLGMDVLRSDAQLR